MNHQGSGRLPNFFIIGAHRSGTTSLARTLGGHPQIFVPERKELHYFDWQFERGEDWYRRQFALANGARAVGEATQTYLYVKQAAARMASVVPDARLIAILRNPVDRAYSHYWQERARRRENLSFEGAIGAEPERLAGPDPIRAAIHAYLDRGEYAIQLERLVRTFPRSSVHVILLEDLKGSPAETVRELCAFLDVPADVELPMVGAQMNTFVSYRIPAVRRAARRMPRLARRVVGRLNVKADSYPPMHPSTRARLIAHFEPHNARLERWLERDLSAWSS